MPKYKIRTPQGAFEITVPRELSQIEIAQLAAGVTSNPADPQAGLRTAVGRVFAGEAQEAKQAIARGSVGEYLVPRILPAAGALAGTLVGGPAGAALGMGPRGTAALTALAEAIGGGGGEQLAQALGLTPSNPEAVVGSAALPLVGRALGAGAQLAGRYGPQALPGRETMLAERMRGIGTRALKPPPAEEVQSLYARAFREGGEVPPVRTVDLDAPSTWRVHTPPRPWAKEPPDPAEVYLAAQQRGTPIPEIPPEDALTLADAFRAYQELGPRARVAGRMGGEAKLKHQAMREAFEERVAQKGTDWEVVRDFLAAQAGEKRIRTAAELDKLAEQAIKPVGAETEKANIIGLRTRLKTPAGRTAFTERMTEQIEPGAWAGIEQELSDLQRAAPWGFGRAGSSLAGRLLRPGAWGGVGYMAGGPEAGLAGIAAEQALEHLGRTPLGVGLTRRAWGSPLLRHPYLAQTFNLGGQALRPFAEEQAP